jgi:hypothetical protein
MNMANGLGLKDKVAASVANSNGKVPKIREILKGLELVEEAKAITKDRLARTHVGKLIEEVNKIKYPGYRNLGEIDRLLSLISSEARRSVLQERAILLGVLEGLAKKEMCREVYDSYTGEPLSKKIETTIKYIVDPHKYEPPKEPPKDMGISYYAPW